MTSEIIYGPAANCRSGEEDSRHPPLLPAPCQIAIPNGTLQRHPQSHRVRKNVHGKMELGSDFIEASRRISIKNAPDNNTLRFVLAFPSLLQSADAVITPQTEAVDEGSLGALASGRPSFFNGKMTLTWKDL